MKPWQKEAFHYGAERVDGTWETLVRTMELYENHSAVPMYQLYTKPDGTEWTDYVHDRILRQLLDRMAPSEEDCAVVLLLIWRLLLRKVRPIKILWAGGRAHDWETLFGNVLRAFHAESQVWRLNGVAGGAWPAVSMPWDALLLPEASVDVLVIEDADARVPLAAAEALFRTVRPHGTVLALSGNDAWREAVQACGTCDAYRAGGRTISCATVPPEMADALHAATPAGQAEARASFIRERLALVASIMEAEEAPSRADAETLAETARQVEQMICALYPTLSSLTAKQHVNEWKQMLIDYALAIGTWDEARAAFAAFAQDIADEKIF